MDREHIETKEKRFSRILSGVWAVQNARNCLEKYIFVATIGQVYAVAGTKVEVPSGWPALAPPEHTQPRRAAERSHAVSMQACQKRA